MPGPPKRKAVRLRVKENGVCSLVSLSPANPCWCKRIQCEARAQACYLRLSPPNDNVLIVPSRNVLLTGSGLRGGSRNISHDATRPRPAGRFEESEERPDHATASCRGTRPKRAACAPSAKAPARQGRRSVGACSARTAIQPQAGRENQAEGSGDTQPRCLSGLRADSGVGVLGQRARHSRRTRDGANVDDRRQTVACQQAAHRQDPPVAAAPFASGRTRAVGHQRACVAGGSGAEAVPDQHDRRRLQPAARAVRAARFDRRKHADGVELRRATWSAGQLLHRQGRFVCNRSEDGAVRHGGGPRRARSFAADADRTSAPGIGHRVDRGALAAGQGPRGTQFPDGAGSSGKRSTGGRRQDVGASQRLPESGVSSLVGHVGCGGSGKQRRCAPSRRQGALAGCF